MISQTRDPSKPRHHFLRTLYRFLLSGGTNTAITYLLYLALLRFIPYKLAYAITYVAGIVIAYFLNRFVVFKAGGRIGTIILFPLMYIAQFFLSLSIVFAWVEVLGANELLAPLAAIIIVIPLNFVCSRLLFDPTRKKMPK
jgi:putative flippase GtrA